MRKLLIAGVGLLVAVVAAVVPAAPAKAGPLDGDVTNLIPDNVGLSVHIATFGTGVPPTCEVHGVGHQTCKRYWLPSGRTDDAVVRPNFDTDGFTVAERDFEVVRIRLGQVVERGTVRRGIFVKIFGHPPVPSKGDDVTCRYTGGRPICEIR